MLLRSGLRRIRVELHQGFDDARVPPYRQGRLVIGVHLGDAVVEELLAIAAIQPLEPVVPGSLDDRGMEGAVEVDQAGAVRGNALLMRSESDYPVDGLLLATLGDEPRRHPFERGAHFVNLDDLVTGVLANHEAPLDRHHEFLGFEQLERLPHRSARDAQSLSEVTSNQPFIWTNAALDDVLAQAQKRLVRQRLPSYSHDHPLFRKEHSVRVTPCHRVKVRHTMSAYSDIAPRTRDIALAVRDFIDTAVVPYERSLSATAHGIDAQVRTQLQGAARDAGIFAPTAPVDLGGLGLSHIDQAVVLEEAGRSLLGPTALNCAAPDEGNILLLDKVATPAQRERYLAPLARGEVRSSFSMTEPSPGAGADPDSLLTQARPSGEGWLINGRKWFITGADGAAFSIVMARTGNAATMFLVDGDNPGMRVERQLDTLDSSFSGGHGELTFADCYVTADAVLGEVDKGFTYAQVRLGPARLTHCMRWLGAARRAHETAVGYASKRAMFGTMQGELGMSQQMIADNEIDIAASRALVRTAAAALDAGAAARRETSIAKTFVAEAVNRIVDRSMQLCGASGISEDLPIAAIFRDIRPFRIYDGPSEVHRWSLARRAIRQSQAGLLPGDWV